jgi:hypothetical protein
MEMFLTLLVLSLLVTVVSALIFAAATRDARPPATAADERLLELPPQVFADDRAPLSRQGVPIEVLLLQIERHVRLEQAAAESFHRAPTVEALHSPTTSPLRH